MPSCHTTGFFMALLTLGYSVKGIYKSFPQQGLFVSHLARRRESACSASLMRPSTSWVGAVMAEEKDGFIRMPDGTELPYKTVPAPLDVLVGHGLGSDPSEKSHQNDISTDIMHEALGLLNNRGNKASTSNNTAVFYTARGHGKSKGWQKTSSIDAFGWPRLGQDMKHVALSSNLDRMVVAGQSMGAASALYMTMEHVESKKRNKDFIRGLILMRPPRAWQERRRVAPEFVQAANVLERKGNERHVVLRGAAKTDLPSPTDDHKRYKTITCPVLLLSHGKDEAHPIETGRVLSKLLSVVQFEVSKDEETARKEWPTIISDWIIANGLID